MTLWIYSSNMKSLNYRTLENRSNLRNTIRNIIMKYWILSPWALKAFIFYHMNYLTSLGTPAKKYPWAIMKGPRSFVETWSMLGEREIIDLIYNLQRDGKIDGVCVDVGAWVGKYSLLMAKKAKKVICIEPDKLNFKFIKKNIELNNLKNIEPIQAALDVKDGTTKLYVSHSTASHSIMKYGFGYKVKTISLKSLLDHIGENVDLIKMDIEGAEFNILRTLDKGMANQIRYWIVECHSPKKEDQHELEIIFRNNGYSVRWINIINVDFPYLFASRS